MDGTDDVCRSANQEELETPPRLDPDRCFLEPTPTRALA